MSWREAFRKQAASDFAQFKMFSAQGSLTPMCHRLQHLQMASEKVAKSFLIGPDDECPEFKHRALVRFLRVLPSIPDIRERLRFGTNHKQFKAYIDSLIPLAEQLETLAPLAKDDHMNSEYPWKDRHGKVVCPAEHDYPEFARQAVVRMQVLLEDLLQVRW